MSFYRFDCQLQSYSLKIKPKAVQKAKKMFFKPLRFTNVLNFQYRYTENAKTYLEIMMAGYGYVANS